MVKPDFLFVHCVDPLGRKRSMIIVNIPFVIGWLMLFRATAVWEVFFGFAMQGLAIGLMEAPVVTYLGEIWWEWTWIVIQSQISRFAKAFFLIRMTGKNRNKKHINCNCIHLTHFLPVNFCFVLLQWTFGTWCSDRLYVHLWNNWNVFNLPAEYVDGLAYCVSHLLVGSCIHCDRCLLCKLKMLKIHWISLTFLKLSIEWICMGDFFFFTRNENNFFFADSRNASVVALKESNSRSGEVIALVARLGFK